MTAKLGEGLSVSLSADAAIGKNIVVVRTTTGVALPSGVTDVPFGVTDSATTAAGQAIRVIVAGPAKVTANGAFADGDALAIAATTGRVDTAASTNYPVGQAVGAAAAAAEVVNIIVKPSLVPLA